MKILPILSIALGLAWADGPGRIESKHIARDFALTADPDAPQWKGVKGVFTENDQMGRPVPGHRTEIRSRWTNENIYFLFVCPYQNLNLKPDPSTAAETAKLWQWDVAEVFVGADFERIKRYKEFQVSPQSEWVDLDIDRDTPQPEGGWKWNSGYKVKGRIDAGRKIWYGEMQIPIQSIDARPPRVENELRINFYRLQSAPPTKRQIAWQPTNASGYHVPEAFGRLVLVK